MAYEIIKKHAKFNHTENSNIFPALWGMVVHETATPGASDEAEFNYTNSGDHQAGGSTYIDNDSITEFVTIEPGRVERAWHAGPTANAHFIGVELCRPKVHDVVYFQNVWNRAVWYFAYKFTSVLKQCKVTAPVFDRTGKLITVGNLMSHEETTRAWHETNHVDPVAYFKEYGKTVDDFRRDVQKLIDAAMLFDAVKFFDTKINIDENLWAGTDNAKKVLYVNDLLIKLATAWQKEISK